MAKVYQFVGEGSGIPGLPHQIKKTDGDLWLKEHKRLESMQLKASAEAESRGDHFEPSNLAGMPGAILQDALDNKSYKLVERKEEKTNKPEKESEVSNG